MSHTTPVAGVLSVAGVLLAAGGSSRLGRPKQLLVWRGEPLVRRAARAALEAGSDELVVVVGAHRDRVEAALEGLELRIVHNADWRRGMASSLATGVAATSADAVLVLLADQPCVDAALLRRLIDAGRAGHRRVACAYAGRLGVPALLAGPGDRAALEALEGDRGARDLLAAEPHAVHAIPAEQAAFDIDDEAAWRGFLEQHDGA